MWKGYANPISSILWQCQCACHTDGAQRASSKPPTKAFISNATSRATVEIFMFPLKLEQLSEIFIKSLHFLIVLQTIVFFQKYIYSSIYLKTTNI